MKNLIVVILACACIAPAFADGARSSVSMIDRGASTFYVDVQLEGAGTSTFLVDTGSSYMTINEDLLASLKEGGQATYVKDLRGTLADGSQQVVPVYRIASLVIGDHCRLDDVQAAVFPGHTRNILGLSALSAAAPFEFSVDPPELRLSNCAEGNTIVASEDAVASTPASQ